MASVILVDSAGVEHEVTTTRDFNHRVYNQGWLPKTGTIESNYLALLGGTPPSGGGQSYVTVNQLENALDAVGTWQNVSDTLARRDDSGGLSVEWLSVDTVVGAGGQPINAQDLTRKDYVDRIAAIVGAAGAASAPTAMAIGDSITANGNALVNSTTFRPDMSAINDRSYMMWAHMLSGARFRWLGDVGTGGYTPAQIRSTHLPTVLAMKPTYCVVLSGQNNPTQLSDIQATWEALLSAGITPILATLPATGTDASRVKLDMFIREYAATRGLPLVDFLAATVDPTGSNSTYKTGFHTGDNVHPSGTGAKAMGQALSDVFRRLIPADRTALRPPTWESRTPTSGASPDQGLLNYAPLFLNNLTNWGWSWLTAAGTVAFATDAAVQGRKVTYSTTGTPIVVAHYLDNMVAGHTYSIDAVLGANATGGTAAWGFRLVDGTVGTPRLAFRSSVDLTFGAAVHLEVTLPSPLPNAGHRFDQYVDTAAGSVSIGQLAVRDLTALGIRP